MAFEDNLPQSADEMVQKSLTDVQRELEKVPNANKPNAFLESNWLRAIPVAGGNRAFDNVLQLKEAVKLNMPDTAEEEFADRWGSIYIGDRTAATGAVGNVAATGVAASPIPISTVYQLSGIQYESTSAATVTAQSLSVDTLERTGDIVTVTTDDDHLLGSNVEVTIVNAVETDYNGVKEIQVTGAKTFTYSIDTTPTSPATGTITADFTAASVPLQAIVPVNPEDPFGAATNQLLDAPLSLASPVAGVDNVANVDFSQLTGGADEESDPNYKTRYTDKIRNPVSHFATSDIDQQIRAEVPGVTRTFIQKSGQQIGSISVTSINRFDTFAKVVTATPHGLFDGAQVTITGAVESAYNVADASVLVINTTSFTYLVAGSPSTPATGTIVSTGVIPLGRVQTYFTRDLDADPIPTAPEIAEVNTAILEITPANTPDSFVITSAPTPLPQDFDFTELTPDSTTMRAAVTANLDQFFGEQVDVNVNIDEDAYRAAIFNTIDPDTGFTVTSFELSSPTGDIAVGTGELPTHGTDDYSALP